MQESSLHNSLKLLYAAAPNSLEVSVDGYWIDAIQDGFLIEVQTRNFVALKPKLKALLPQHRIRIVHPIPSHKWIVRLPAQGDTQLQRRKSPRKGRPEDIFIELVRIAQFISHPNFSLEIIMIEEEEIRRDDGRGSWRRKGVSIVNRRLLGVNKRETFYSPDDYRCLLPTGLPQTFTNKDLATYAKISLSLAGKMSYCLRNIGILTITGKSSNALLYTRTPARYNSPV